MAVIYAKRLFELLLTIIGTIISSLLVIIGIIILITGIVKRKKYNEVPPSKRKKYPKALIAAGSVLICISLFLVGTFTYSLTHEKKLTAEEKCEIIIEAVQNKEKEPIKELFCEKAKNTLDLDTELDSFFNYINGNIVSYDKPHGTVSEASSTYEEGSVKKTSRGYIRNIRTDTDNEYTIFIYSFDVSEEDLGLAGMVLLGVTAPMRYRFGMDKDENYLKDYFYLIKTDYPE